MKHIHIALALIVCSFVTLSLAKNTLVYRRYHRKPPSNRKSQQNVVEIVEVFKTNRRPPAFLKSDKSIEQFLLCDAKCERKRFLRRRKMCIRTGRLCPTRPSVPKLSSTTEINVSIRPIYKKPIVYQQNPYGNRNPDYTHLYPWSRPSVTVTKYQPDKSKDFNMTIVEVNKDVVVTTKKYDYDYYDGENDDRYQQRRSTTYRVPTTQWAESETSTISSFPQAPTSTITNVFSTTPDTELHESTDVQIISSSTESIPSPTENTAPATDYLTTQRNELEAIEVTTEFSFPAPPTSTTKFDTSTASSAQTLPTEIWFNSTEAPTSAEASTSTSSEALTTTSTEATTTTSTEAPTTPTTEASTSTSTEALTTTSTEAPTTTSTEAPTTTSTEAPTTTSTEAPTTTSTEAPTTTSTEAPTTTSTEAPTTTSTEAPTTTSTEAQTASTEISFIPTFAQLPPTITTREDVISTTTSNWIDTETDATEYDEDEYAEEEYPDEGEDGGEDFVEGENDGVYDYEEDVDYADEDQIDDQT